MNNSGGTGGYDYSDDHSDVLKHLLKDSEFAKSLEQFNETSDLTDEFHRKTAENVDQVMTLLEGKLHLVDELQEIKDSIQRDLNQEITIYDFQRALYEVHGILQSDELLQIFAPQFDRFIEAVRAIDLIATGTLGIDDGSQDKMKAYVQGDIMLIDSLTAEEKTVFIQVADEFMPGEPFDTSNPDTYGELVADAEQDKKDQQEITVFRGLVNDLIDIHLGNGIELQTNDVAFKKLRELASIGLFTGDASMFQSEISELLQQLRIEESAYHDAIKSIEKVIDSDLR